MRPATYSPAAKVLHWLVVALIAVQLALGWLMPGARRTTPPDLLNNGHMSFGVIILAVIVIRAAWRAVAGPPAPEAGMPRWQIAAAHWTHLALYGLVFALVFSGWANAAAHNWPIALFWPVTLPTLLPAGAAWVRDLGELHETIVWVLLGFVGLHVAAALGHHFILGDNVLRRMLPMRTTDRG
ncbi:MAG: cytochrome b [Alphaproteobacteria bacterium]|nr:cytochrome b [Alphaproteobacteria bacterium]